MKLFDFSTEENTEESIKTIIVIVGIVFSLSLFVASLIIDDKYYPNRDHFWHTRR